MSQLISGLGLGFLSTEEEESTEHDVNATESSPQDTNAQTPKTTGGGWGRFLGDTVAAISKTSTMVVSSAAGEIREFAGALQSENKELVKDIKTKTTKLVSKAKGAATTDDSEKTGVPESADVDATAQAAPGDGDEDAAREDDVIDRVAHGIDNVTQKVWGTAMKLWSGANDDNDEEEEEQVSEKDAVSASILLRRRKLAALQTNEETYLRDPPDAPPSQDALSRLPPYAQFKKTFLDEWISKWEDDVKLVIASQELVRAQYRQLVPDEVSKQVFWCRYIYSVKSLDMEDKRRQQMLSRLSSREQDGTSDRPEVDLSWDDDEEEDAKTQVQTKQPSSSANASERPKKAASAAAVAAAVAKDVSVDSADIGLGGDDGKHAEDEQEEEEEEEEDAAPADDMSLQASNVHVQGSKGVVQVVAIPVQQEHQPARPLPDTNNVDTSVSATGQAAANSSGDSVSVTGEARAARSNSDGSQAQRSTGGDDVASNSDSSWEKLRTEPTSVISLSQSPSPAPSPGLTVNATTGATSASTATNAQSSGAGANEEANDDGWDDWE